LIYKYLLVIYLSILFNKLNAQVIINGTISNPNSSPINAASIVVLGKDKNEIKSFAISTANGKYIIKVSLPIDSLYLRVTCLNYATKLLTILNSTQECNIKLDAKVSTLPEVIVKANPITVNGDTTSYNVGSFATKNDRVIGDVIAKLPGVDVDANGRITYNGKAISHYYIDGMDLLESKYNMANNNIDYKLVEQVQLLNSHQNINLLDSLKNSTNTAINIKLSKKAKGKFIGKLGIGLGISPLLWDNELLGMQFKKNFQTISAYKNNNTGVILGNELLENVSIGEVGNQAETNTKEELLSIIPIDLPRLLVRRYSFNNSHLLFSNMLKVLKNNAQLRFNISFLSDTRKGFATSNTSYFLPNDTVTIIERKENTDDIKQIQTALDYTINTTKIYLKNNFKAELIGMQSKGVISQNNIITQNLKTPFAKLSNSFSVIKKINTKLYTVNSTINYNETPQCLLIEPGQFASQFNQSIPYDNLKQRVRLTNFNTHNNVSFLSKLGKLNQELKVGNEVVYKKMNSSLEKLYQSNITKFNDSFSNKLSWSKVRTYISSDIIIKKNDKQVLFTLPIEHNFISLSNNLNYVTRRRSFLFFNPSINLTIPLSMTFELSAYFARQNSIGNLSQQSTGLIMSNYRSIGNNDTLLQKQVANNYSLNLSFKAPLKGIFGYLSLSYTNTLKNTIYTQSFNGIFNTVTLLAFDNKQKNIITQANINKYFLDKKVNLALNISHTKFNYLQSIQNKIVASKNNSTGIKLKLSYNGTKYLLLENSSNYQFSTNKIEILKSANSFNNFTESLKVNFFIKKKIILSLMNEYYKIWNENLNVDYLFCDLVVAYKYKKIDLEFNLLNLTNNKQYTTIALNNNFKQTNDVTIRPINAILKFHFNF
jgi:hypothetical protein